MKNLLVLFIIAVQIAACTIQESQADKELSVNGPIKLHLENQHYFSFKGKPIVLISSAEHYGAVLNLDFDYRKYLEGLSEDGMNYTRIFTGSYFEIEGESFGIQNNTLAPSKDRLITPWPLAQQDLSGGVKYDLSQWNDTYFERLRSFMATAADNDIIVEVTLFSSIYREKHWDICPQNPANNINILHDVNRLEAHTVNNGTLLAFQEKFIRKIVNELNEYNNFFFEIQNEPWSDRPVPVYNILYEEELNPDDWTVRADFADEESLEWQEKMASIIVDEENNLAQKHLIAQNYTNFKAPVPVVSDHISIINFHYAMTEAVEWNYHFDRVLGFDESGFTGSGDQPYRRQAWRFILSGGGLFNNLDYSYFVGHEDGSGENEAPGGGSKPLRKQLKILSDFIHSFEVEKLHPNPSCISSSPGLIPYVMSDKNSVYAIYLRAIGTESTHLHLETGEGVFHVQEINTITGACSDPATLKSSEGLLKIDIQIPQGELALKIIRE